MIQERLKICPRNENMPPLARIAQSLRVDENSARYFCNYIQRQFTQPPSFKMIAQAVEQLAQGNRSREQVIEWMRCNWPDLILVDGRNLSLPRPPRARVRIGVPEARPFQNNPELRSFRQPDKSAVRFADPHESETYTSILSRDPRDYYQRIQKCPHGVVSWGHCAICDPDGYRDYVSDE